MTLIAGASQFLNQAAVTNKLGLAGQSANVLSESAFGAATLLDIGRNNSVSGLGLSSSARALNRQFVDNSSTINTLFSFAGGGSSTFESALTQIKALRSSVPVSRTIEAPDLSQNDSSSSNESNIAETSSPGSILDEQV